MPTVLIVDDSLFQRLLLSKIVNSAGYKTIEAKDGHEGLNLLRSKQPEVAFFDLNMPGLSGQEVLDVAQAEKLPTAIVVITADIQETTRERCLTAGARKLLSKPVQEADIVNILHELCPELSS